jgi:pimeloyl-ACP methyl ester carboxylesterase
VTTRAWRAGTAGAVLVAAAAVAVATPSATAATGTPGGPAPHDPCQRTSWRAGTAELCSGVLVYRDYVIDDFGAAGPFPTSRKSEQLGSLSATAGDQRYADPAQTSSADLVDLAVRLVGDELVAVFRLNALYKADSTTVALAVDTDDDRTTGGGAWPGVNGVRSAGWEVVRTASAGDVAANTVTLRMPAPSGTRWRLQALTAQSNGTVMNVAFRGPQEVSGLGNSTWWEGRQAQVLKTGDITEFGHVVEVADLRGGVTREADQWQPGLGSRVFTSRWTIGSGEGYSYQRVFGRHGGTGTTCEQEFISHGRFQPYSVYVPTTLPTQPGVQVNLHGCNANHTSQITGAGFRSSFGDQLGRVVVAPLGRGPIGYYSDISEADVLEVVDDVERTLRPDPESWFLSGYSMGGYGALRLAALYPDRWAGLTNWVGFTGDVTNTPAGVESPRDAPSGAIGNVIHFVRNLEHIPSEHLYAAGDELVQVHTAAAMQQALSRAGLDHRFYLHPAAEHLTFALLDRWEKESAKSKDRRLVRDPARVVYRTDGALAYPEYELRHDRAYWVSQVRPAKVDADYHDNVGFSDVDLTTSACGGALPVRTASNSAGPTPVPWVSQEITTTGRTPLTGDRLEGRLANVASLTVDAARTCLAGRDVTYSLTTDGPATVALTDGRRIVLPAAGTHTGVLAASTGAPVQTAPVAAAGRGQAAGVSARALPATGAPAAVPVVAGALLLGAAVLRRRLGQQLG